MRTLRLLLAVGLGLAPTLAPAAAGTTPAFAGGGAGMTLTATMDGQDQRLLVGTQHTVYITLADTPGESDLRDITISLDDVDPHPLPVTCPAGQNGHLSLEPEEELHCTSVATAEIGYRTLIARAVARVPSEGHLVRTAPLHYTGFLPPPPPRRVPVVRTPVGPPESAAARPPHLPVALSPPPAAPPHPADPPRPADPPHRVVGGPVEAPPSAPMAHGCSGRAEDRSGSRCCGSEGKSGDCGTRHGGLAFTGMSLPMLAAAAWGGLLLLVGGVLLVRRFARR